MRIVALLLLVPLAGVTIVALFTTVMLLLPTPIARTRHYLENALGRSLLLGLVNFIFFGLLAAIFAGIADAAGRPLAGIFILLTFAILFGLILLALLGLVALGHMLGERMGGGQTPFRTYLRGATLLLLAGLAPYIGWFIFTPLALLAGLGAAISALVRRRGGSPPVDAN